MVNPDKSESSVVEDLEAYREQAKGVGGRKKDPNSIEYTTLAALVAFYLLMASNRPVTEAGAVRVLLQEIQDEDRELLGMRGDLTGTRGEVILSGLMAGASAEQAQASAQAKQEEHARFAKFWSEVIKPIDPSPFFKNSKLTNKERDAILADSNHEQRRINRDEQERNTIRLHELTNKIVAASAVGAPVDGWKGDIVTDETIVIILGGRYGHGTKDEHKISVDPDAQYWAGKTGESIDKAGFGYGITYALRMPRPYGRQIPTVAVGIHVGRPNGGTTNDFVQAHQSAELHGLTQNNRGRICAADMGFTTEDAWTPTMMRLGYDVVSDYPSHWSKQKLLRDETEPHPTTKKTYPVDGPELVNGCILCPGAAGLGPQYLPDPAMAIKDDEASVKETRRRSELLTAYSMPMRLAPKQLTTSKRGRPKKGTQPLQEKVFSITVQCPARAGNANCLNYPSADGLRYADVPDIPNPPHPNENEKHLRPRACRKEFVNYQLTTSELKWLQPHIWGSHYHTDIYETFRSANERFHSQLKSRSGGGVSERQWLQVRGIAKFSIMAGIATAITNTNLITSYISSDEGKTPTPRERARRLREYIFKKERKAA